MIREELKLLIGINNDPQFVPIVMFGLGGIFVEILKDISLCIAPITQEEAIEINREIKEF